MLAGGAGRRLGGVDKPGLMVDGRSLLDRALAALGDVPTVVVGPVRPTVRQVGFVTEEPPGSGPAAALSAGVAALSPLPDHALVAVLAADLPAVSTSSVVRLTTAVVAGVDGAVLVDADGRQQLLLGVWRWSPLVAAVAARPSWAGSSLRSLLAPLRRIAVPAVGAEAADVDTPEQQQHWSAT